MSELNKNYSPASVEDKWYEYWLSKNYFKSIPDNREPYTVVIPPPNVTGVLHMGHCLNNTIQDILIRRARLQGKNACWVPGTDHASIATEAKVVAMLRERGIAKSSLSRGAFLDYAWEWKEKYGGIILQQLKKLGCSVDWDRTSFTMDEDYYASVIKVFIDLYNKNIIYRGLRMVNWDPVGKTALSDEEVIFKDIDSQLFYVKYRFVNNPDQFITVATTRPETILGDIAICVNPSDERYQAFIGEKVIVPLINREIPVIADEYVTADFGTGALKVTPAHDKNDYELGNKHQLKAIDTLDESGKFTAAALQEDNPSALILGYEGIDRFDLRKQIAKDIEAEGLLAKIEPYKGQVGTSERTGAVIESRLSLQWFVNMQLFMEQNPEVLSSVTENLIQFYPEKTKNTYTHWLSNIKDWCISRQLWWGQRIPAWYDELGNCFVATTLEEAKAKQTAFASANGISITPLKQDEDCLDTWFSSWLWPIEVFKGISHPNNEEVNYYYPTTTLVTGQDIIFFWVARMIMAGYAYKGKQPFQQVYFTGMVRDKQGRKMSKQLGNSPDLLELIEKYGADAVRFGIMFSSPAGNDLMFDESSLEQGRNFNNKLWNALKLLKMWEEKKAVNKESEQSSAFAINWFNHQLNAVKAEIEQLMNQFKISEALKTIYSLIWDDFCSWYLEWVKPAYEQPIDTGVYEQTTAFFEELLQLLHPFMPFITEELYHLVKNQTDDLTVKTMQAAANFDTKTVQEGELLKKVITAIREAKAKNQIKNKEAISLFIESNDKNKFTAITTILSKQVNASTVEMVASAKPQTLVVAVETDKFYIESGKTIDTSEMKETLLKDLAYQQNFLASVMKKLSNDKFVQNAKAEVIALERKKKEDAEARIKTIEESLAHL
ncbi:MAG: valine--tRNA ligase [Chitinophagaceae bacterium]